MRSISVLPLLPLLLACACDNSDTSADVVGKIGWVFNYRDWSKPLCPCADLEQSPCEGDATCTWDGTRCNDLVAGDCTINDIRTCDNLPVELYGAPAYQAVATIGIKLVEKSYGSTSLDREFDCAGGDGTRLLELQGVSRSLHALTLTALASDGTVLYAGETSPDIDFSSYVEQRYELRTPTGDLSFDIDYPGSGVGLCPSSNIESLYYELTAKGETTPTLTGTATPACDAQDIFGNVPANKLYIRNIPYVPETGSTGSYIPTAYAVKVAARDTNNSTAYCGELERNVNPGLNPNHSAQPMTAGACAVWSCSPATYDAGDACDCDCGRYDPDCEHPNVALNGCTDYSRCASPTGTCECIDFYQDQAGACVWAGQPSGVPRTDVVKDLSAADLTTLCTWVVNHQGGKGFVHNCAGPTITIGSVNQCRTDHSTATCEVSVVEDCWNENNGNPCDMSGSSCVSYLNCL